MTSSSPYDCGGRPEQCQRFQVFMSHPRQHLCAAYAAPLLGKCFWFLHILQTHSASFRQPSPVFCGLSSDLEGPFSPGLPKHRVFVLSQSSYLPNPSDSHTTACSPGPVADMSHRMCLLSSTGANCTGLKLTVCI